MGKVVMTIGIVLVIFATIYVRRVLADYSAPSE